MRVRDATAYVVGHGVCERGGLERERVLRPGVRACVLLVAVDRSSDAGPSQIGVNRGGSATGVG